MAKFAQRFGFNLPDTLTRYRKRLANFFQRVLGTIFQTETHLDDPLFARREGAQHLRRLVFQVHVDDRFGRRHHGAVLNKVAKMRIFFFANRRLQRNGLLRDLQHFADFGYRDVHALGDFFGSRFAAEFLYQLARRPDQLIDGLDHVNRNTDGSRLISDGAGNGLPDPPCGIRRKLVTAAVFELVHGFHQTDVAFLDQVQKLQPAIRVLLGNGNHQAHVGFDKFALGGFTVNVALNDFPLRAFQFGITDTGFLLQLFEIDAVLALHPAKFFFCVFAAGAFDLFFEVIGLTVEHPHGVRGFVQTLNQALALRVGELQLANAGGHHDLRAAQRPAGATVLFRFLFLLDGRELFQVVLDFLVVLADVVDLAGKVFQSRNHYLVSDFFFIERDQFFDGADAFLQVVTQSKNFPDDNRRARERFEHAQLAALNSLGDFHFAFACEQRDSAHFAQVHAHRIIGFFERAALQVKFYVFAFFNFFEFLFGRQAFAGIQDVNALRANRGKQIVKIVRRMNVAGDEVVYLVISQVTFFFSRID